MKRSFQQIWFACLISGAACAGATAQAPVSPPAPTVGMLSASAEAPPFAFSPRTAETAPPQVNAGRIWADGEFLLWWMKGAALPPLVTASPSGTPGTQAGVLGAPATSVLFG